MKLLTTLFLFLAGCVAAVAATSITACGTYGAGDYVLANDLVHSGSGSCIVFTGTVTFDGQNHAIALVSLPNIAVATAVVVGPSEALTGISTVANFSVSNTNDWRSTRVALALN